MAYGLLIKNASGNTVIQYNDQVVNLETVDVTTSLTLTPSSSQSLTVPDIHDSTKVVFDTAGLDAQLQDLSYDTTVTDTLTVTNTNTNFDRSVDLSFVRLA